MPRSTETARHPRPQPRRRLAPRLLAGNGKYSFFPSYRPTLGLQPTKSLLPQCEATSSPVDLCSLSDCDRRLFQAAMATFKGVNDNAKSKLEEDLTPLVERHTGPQGSIVVAFAQPPDMRSLFSVSVRQRIKATTSVTSLRDVMDLHPGIEKTLNSAGADGSASLVLGDSFHELVFSGALVDLGDETNAGFDLTLWYHAGAAVTSGRSWQNYRSSTTRIKVASPNRLHGAPSRFSGPCRGSLAIGPARSTKPRHRWLCPHPHRVRAVTQSAVGQSMSRRISGSQGSNMLLMTKRLRR